MGERPGASDEAGARRALFAVVPAEFVVTRQALVKQLRLAGDREAATRVGRLSKPSVVAWVANALHREARGAWDGAMRAGGALREAQRSGGLTAQAMQDLIAAQRKAVAELMRRAAGLAEAARVPYGQGHAVRLQATLEALCGGAPARHGQLEAELEPPSFDALAPALAPPMPSPPTGTAGEGRDKGKDKGKGRGRDEGGTVTPRDRVQAHVLQGLRELEAVRDARDAQRRQAQRRAGDAAETLQVARREVEAAERRLEQALAGATRAARALADAETTAAGLAEAVTAAERAVSRARAALAGGAHAPADSTAPGATGEPKPGADA